MRIALAQINTTAGDIDGNVRQAIDAYNTASSNGANLIVFPELTITGYPPEDLLFREDFLQAAVAAVGQFAASTSECVAIIGAPSPSKYGIRNAAIICRDGYPTSQYFKRHLPNYGVFDEKRYFTPPTSSPDSQCFKIAGVKVGITICEDIWVPQSPVFAQVEAGAQLLVNISASPYQAGRINDREELLSAIAIQSGVPLVYVNLVGGQDELVFDGGSLVVNERGETHSRAVQFYEEIHMVDVRIGYPNTQIMSDQKLAPVEEVYEALVLGVHDYFAKTGYEHALLGLSGGIDSSLVAAIAVEALSPSRVLGVLMPSRYSSQGSIDDALQLAQALGIETKSIPIDPTHTAMENLLRRAFPTEWGKPGVTEENIQARARGNILMAISNKFGGMVLTTGNKSEMALGYATLYGDMAGGFAVIKDVPKTLVYQLCEHVNERNGREVIPKTVISKPPSAELRFGQKDSDSLPPYEILDPIIQLYVTEDLSAADIIKLAITDPETVIEVCRKIDRNEYKRRQAPPGIRISPKAFGKDRRLPIANGWK